MAILSTMWCPECGTPLSAEESDATGRRRARSTSAYKECLRRCEPCGVGLSNSTNVPIYSTPDKSVPAQVRAGLADVLQNAINVRNRKTKIQKFCSHNSEDAVTWTIFKHFQDSDSLADLAGFLQVPFAIDRSTWPIILLWGVPLCPGDIHAQEAAATLVKVIDAIEKHPHSRSEPDVVLDYGPAGVVFIEVKLESRNEVKHHDYAGWAKYVIGTDSFHEVAGVAHTGLYELTRNWRIAWDYAGGRPMCLINLGFPSLFKAKHSQILDRFEACLSVGPQHSFRRLLWPELIRAIPRKPQWLRAFIADRRLAIDRNDLVLPILEVTSVSDCLNDLQETHDYLVRCAKRALERASLPTAVDHWGADVKRLHVDLIPQGKPYLVPRRLNQHNLLEVINQCATLERMIDCLAWVGTSESGLTDYTVTKCHPATSSDKKRGTTHFDNDLVLAGPNGAIARFEISDVSGRKDSNRKEVRDLVSLGVLAEERGLKPAAMWPNGRLFLVVAESFANRILSQQPNGKWKRHFHYWAQRTSTTTTVVEVRQGPLLTERDNTSEASKS